MKKKTKRRISKFVVIICCFATIFSLIAVNAFAWTWTNSQPRDNFAYGTNSYSLVPLTSAQMSRVTDGGYKTYTYNSPSIVSFEYGNGFTVGFPLGRQITANQDGYMSVGIGPYLSTYNSLFQTNEEHFSTSFAESYLPLTNSLDANGSEARTQLDYQLLRYNIWADEDYGSLAGTSASFNFGSSYLTMAQLQYGGILILEIEVAYPYSDVVNGVRDFGLQYSFDYVVYNTTLEAFQSDYFSDSLTQNEAFRVEGSERTVTFAGQLTTIPTTKLYFDVLPYVYECPGIKGVDIPGTSYNPSEVGARATPIALHNLSISTLDDVNDYPSSSIGSLSMYMGSLRPYDPADKSIYDGLSIWSDSIQKAYRNVGFAGSGSGGIIPEGNFEITQNGSYDVTNFATVTVDVEYKIPDGLDVGPLGSTLGDTLEGFFGAEIFPGVYLWTLLLIPFALGLVFSFIKFFAGG